MKKILFLIAFLAAQMGFAQTSMSATAKAAPIPYESVENQPLYPGGINEFMKFIGKNFQAPSDENFSGGIMKVSFVIEANGSISDIKVLNDLGHGTAQEITRVLQSCPKWTPADHEGKPVRVLFTLPVTIRV